MSIRHKSEGERARIGKMTLQIKEKDREILAMQKCDNNSEIIGALGANSKDFRTWIRKKQMDNYRHVMQMPCLLETARIIRKAWIPKAVCYNLLFTTFQPDE